MAQTVNIIFGAVTVGGTANAITATYSPTLTALTDKRTLSFKAASNNSGAVTFSPDGLAVRDVTKRGGSALVTGDILQNGVYIIQYDSTNTRWELINPSAYQPLDADLTAIAALTTTAYGRSLLEMASLAALRSDIGDTFTITCFGAALNPVDSTTYYIGIGRTAPTTTATDKDFNLGFAATLIGAIVTVSNNTVSGSNENSTLQLRNVTQGTSTLIGTFLTNATSAIDVNTTFTGLNISVGASDFICPQWDAAAYSTNPQAVLTGFTLIFKKV